MPKLERINQEIFASSSGSREVTAFGTAKSENPTYSKDVSAIQNSNYLQGWSSAVLADKAPYMEDSNALYYAITRQLAYLYQAGVPEWNAETTYYALVSYVQVNGTIYQSLTNDNVGNNPTTDTTNWQEFWGTVKSDINTLNSTVSGLQTSVNTLNNNKSNTSLNNINSAGLIKIIQAIMPNWSKAVNRSFGTTYTATQYGWICATAGTAQDAIGVWINGHLVAYTEAYGARDTSGYGCLVPVSKGNTYRATQGGRGTPALLFVPCGGN